MDDSTISQARIQTPLHENLALDSNKASSQLETPQDQTIKKTSTEIFNKIHSDANQHIPSELQKHNIQEIEIDDGDDEDLKELLKLQQEANLIKDNKDTTSNEKSEVHEERSQELQQAQAKDSLKEEALSAADSHQKEATLQRNVERNELAGARRLELNIESLKALAKNAYIYRKDGGFENCLQYARLTHEIREGLKEHVLSREVKGQSASKGQPAANEAIRGQGQPVSNAAAKEKISPPRAPLQASLPLQEQNLLIVKNRTIYVPENLQNEFKPGREIELPNEHGVMERVQIDHIVILNKEEYAEFRQNMSVAIQQTISAPVMQHPQENRKTERNEQPEAQEQKPIKHARRDLNDDVSAKPKDVRQFVRAQIDDQATSPSEKRKQDIVKLEKILDDKYRKTLESNKKEELSKEDIQFFTHKETEKEQLLEEAKAKIEVVDQEILQACILLQQQDDISPLEKEKYRKIELKIKEVSAVLTKNIGSETNPVSEKIKALKEYFEQVSTFVLEISNTSVNTTKVAPKLK